MCCRYLLERSQAHTMPCVFNKRGCMSHVYISTLLSVVCFFVCKLQALEVEMFYENDHISVAKVTLAPHEEVGLHRDVNPQLVVVLQGGTVTRLEADGRTTDVLFPTGKLIFRNADPEGELHRTVNPSDAPIELFVVQLKKTENLSAKLREAANAYVQFINRLSQGEEFDQFTAAKTLLSPGCRKIFNGHLITSSADEFVQDLLCVYKTHGPWTIRPEDIIVSLESNTAVLRLLVDMEADGKFTEILLLKFDQNHLIDEINIVFNKVEEGYGFSTR